MRFQYLDWDSDFFRIKTGRIDFSIDKDTRLDLIKKLLALKSKDYKLVYCFSDKALPFDLHNISWNGYLVDQKVLYQYSIDPIDVKREFELNPKYSIVPYSLASANNQLFDLSIQSGEYSRFNKDKKLPLGSFQNLYKEWINNAVNGSVSDKVFVAIDRMNKEKGLITLKLAADATEIGLLGVDQSARGQGIASALIKKAKGEAFLNGNIYLNVTTQLANIPACRLYEKASFTQQTVTYVYHFWII